MMFTTKYTQQDLAGANPTPIIIITTTLYLLEIMKGLLSSHAKINYQRDEASKPYKLNYQTPFTPVEEFLSALP